MKAELSGGFHGTVGTPTLQGYRPSQPLRSLVPVFKLDSQFQPYEENLQWERDSEGRGGLG